MQNPLQTHNQDKLDKELLRQCKLILEYFKLELVVILPEIIEAQKMIELKYGDDTDKNDKKINKARKKLNGMINQAKQTVLSDHLDPKFEFSSYKKLTSAIKKTGSKEGLKLYEEYKCLNKILHRAIGKVDLNQSVAQLDMTMNQDMEDLLDEESPFEMRELEALITIDDPSITQDKYKQILTKFYAVIRYEMYQKVQQYWSTNWKKSMFQQIGDTT